ncbi:pyridoxal phosphate-dependent decarboxylase family protein [Undibacterium sp. Dicai25W]|uniref:pyridoxal phosphate-dependent decarboxylase family protein n=1 Tax=Undibacterium sp. Dicai25W TaxID=3413034 RepID=UPI003BF0C300
MDKLPKDPIADHPQDAHQSLDPEDWSAFRQQSHRMLDDMLDFVEHLRERPVWQPIPQTSRAKFQVTLPQQGQSLESAHETFMQDILPYGPGNSHPGFMGWVQGGGTPVGMLADMLAAGLNANVGGRDQMPVEVERQIVRWMRELFVFPETASGVFVTGTSMANLMAVLVARTVALGKSVRQQGLREFAMQLTAYTSVEAHGCVAQAMDLAGFGTAALRRIPSNDLFEMDTQALEAAIEADRAAGFQPFFIAGTAGSVDVGAVDPLNKIADIAARQNCWFHVDGAFGALGMMSPKVAPLLQGIQRADSIAFDFHKWGQVQYDAGFLLVRDAAQHMDAFAAPVAYLRRESRGLAGGSPWPCDFGPDLSRGFRALKTWFTLQVYGTEKLGNIISQTCDLAQYLVQQISQHSSLELVAPVALNVVCFRYLGETKYNSSQRNLDDLNRDIVADLHESGIAVPSTTTVRGQLAIRVAIVNHRTHRGDLDAMLNAVIAVGKTRTDQATE